MIFKNIKRFIICVFLLTAVCLCACNSVFAAPGKAPTIVVLSDTGHRNGTTYLICGAASDIIASDIINRMNQTGRIKAPLLGENMSRITQRNIPLYYNTFFKEYKYNYNVDFVNLKRVTRNIPADYVLMVTSGLDIQSGLLNETWWNKWGISVSQPIEPTYRLITMLTLIDKKTYSVVWQDLYQRDIKAKNMDLGVTQFSPNYSQLTKIKKYSNTMSEYVVAHIDEVVNPASVIPADGVVIPACEVSVPEGGTAFDALTAAARAEKVRVDYTGSSYGVYVSGIGYIYEFGFGSLSGWMYRVNGEFPNVSAGNYVLSEGDAVEFVYTCDLGADVGDEYYGD